MYNSHFILKFLKIVYTMTFIEFIGENVSCRPRSDNIMFNSDCKLQTGKIDGYIIEL